MEKINNFISTGIYNEESFKVLESQLSFGILAKTKSAIIYNTQRPIYVTILVESAKNKKCTLQIPTKSRTMETLVPKLNTDKKIAFHCSSRCETFYEDKGFVKHDSVVDSSKYLVHHYSEKMMEKIENLEDEFKRKSKGLKDLVQGSNIDPSKYGYMTNAIVRMLAYNNTFKYLFGCDHVTDLEKEYLDGCMIGALVYADNGTIVEDPIYYDVNSSYPACMASEKFMFPMMEGKEVNIKTECGKNDLEIYNLEILGKHKYWRNSPDNKYNTYQIKILKLLRIPFRYVGENKMIFSNCLRGDDTFGYMHDIYNKKKEGNPYAKELLIYSWGEFSREKNFTVPISELRKDQMSKVAEFCLEKDLAILQTEGERKYKHATARIKPFILAFQRWQFLKKVIVPILNAGFEVYKIKTDGVLTNAPENEMAQLHTMGRDLGELKVEKKYQGRFKVVNSVRMEQL